MMNRKIWLAAGLLMLAMALGLSAGAEEPLPAEGIVEAAVEPTAEPAPEPTPEPTEAPTPEPTPEPTEAPTPELTPEPTEALTPEPTAEPTEAPTPEPTAEPTQEPVLMAAEEPTQEPTPELTTESTQEPTPELTAEPTQEPTAEPTEEPTAEPTEEPAEETTEAPTEAPTQEPVLMAAAAPGDALTPEPTAEPTEEPTQEPTLEPTEEPTPEPTAAPTPFIPQGQAYTMLADGTQMDGSLQDILGEMAWRGESGTVYLLTDEEIRLENMSERVVEQIRFVPDSDTFCDPNMSYTVLVWTGEGNARTLPPIFVKVQATDRRTPTATPEKEATPEPDATGEPTQEPTTEPTLEPTPEPTPEPRLTIGVSAEDYAPGVWSNALPVFTLSGIPEGDAQHMYGVFICDERLVVLSEGRNTYSPEQDGFVSLRFVIMDMMGDLVSISDQYDMMLDFMPPDEPYILRLDYTDTVVQIITSDYESGVESISFNFGSTWQKLDDPQYLMGEKDGKIYEGQILVRDAAGNVSQNWVEHIFAPETPRYYGSYGQKRIKHVPQTLDYSTVNYNALELSFPEGAHTTLTAGDTQLSLSLTGEDGEALAFTAELAAWKREEADEPKRNALLLTAESAEGMNVWKFTGDVYRLLYNSGVEYMVFISGDYITAIPTEGFTGGTAYGKLKAAGVSTRKFAYTLAQDEALLETVMSVAVEEETYLMEEDKSSPMYRYDVLVGDRTLMDKPYKSWITPQDGENE